MNGVCVLLGHTQEECLNLDGTTWESSTCLFEELSESECQVLYFCSFFLIIILNYVFQLIFF